MSLIQRVPFVGPIERFPLSRATVSRGTVYASGQVPIDPITKMIVEGGIAAQTETVLDNLEAVLVAAGSGLDRVLSVTVYLTDISNASAFNDVYRSRFADDHVPARTMIEVSALPNPRFLVEIDAIAAVGTGIPDSTQSAGAAGASRWSPVGIARATITGEDGRLDFGLDPRTADALGVAIAGRIPAGIDVIVGWDSPADEVVAHIVARELEVPRVSAELDVGLISLSRKIAPGERTAIVGLGTAGAKSFDALVTLVTSAGGSVEAVVGVEDV